MSQTGPAPRISLTANKAVTGVLFGLAIITYATRTYIRARIVKQFSTEDVLLLFAVLCLCATTGLEYHSMHSLYDSLAVILHGAESGLLFSLLEKIPSTSKENNAETTLWWLIIFSVKLAYLFFFRRLISRLRDLSIWWWCVIGFTVPAGLVCIAASWLTCPYFTIEKVLSCSGPSADYRVIRDTTITTVLDVVTDILVVSFPVALLWRVRINVRQKIGLGVSLCLSLVMAIVSIVKISFIKFDGGAVDIVWLVFWQQQECSIAVIMVSVSAFRSLFVVNTSKIVSPQDKLSSYWRKRLLQKRNKFEQDSGSNGNELPQIPSATLTGMRTMIGGARMSKWWPHEDEPQDRLLSAPNYRVQATQHHWEGRETSTEEFPLEMNSSSNIRFMRNSSVV